MNNAIISILAAAVLSAMVLSPGIASAEPMVMNDSCIPGSVLNLSANYSTGANLIFFGESGYGLSAGYIFYLADFPPIQADILRTVERARLYRDRVKFI